MPIVDLNRGESLDCIHARRMLHAFSQVVHALIGLEDYRVNQILAQKNITLFPGMNAGLEYAPGDRQILEDELKAAKEPPKKPAKKSKRGKR